MPECPAAQACECGRPGLRRPRRYPSDASDAEWALISPLLPVPAWRAGCGGRPETHCRRARWWTRSGMSPITGACGGRCPPTSRRGAPSMASTSGGTPTGRPWRCTTLTRTGTPGRRAPRRAHRGGDRLPVGARRADRAPVKPGLGRRQEDIRCGRCVKPPGRDGFAVPRGRLRPRRSVCAGSGSDGGSRSCG